MLINLFIISCPPVEICNESKTLFNILWSHLISPQIHEYPACFHINENTGSKIGFVLLPCQKKVITINSYPVWKSLIHRRPRLILIPIPLEPPASFTCIILNKTEINTSLWPFTSMFYYLVYFSFPFSCKGCCHVNGKHRQIANFLGSVYRWIVCYLAVNR